ncbi:TetR/AcrR family transcriptional regulator [Paractinoplanes durhamensis]|uniref:TetR family transcriptional regulator n=1 Tax=Paractinoplanes durhamensis TaxID=113563 RepID=A0ABQ3YYX0_9ACTN|nr:TetR/AcrR family transcriptional regulator [Actinoplanes durhamensis]GIE02773.1 TetR family transcriptional regulator [Actinoplanes durhamensis]
MTTDFSGGGDPRRTIELLWGLREGSRPGPKPRFTVAEIAAAGLAIADADGLAALSMRRVAERLGVSAMSLYTYVPGKAELIDLMLDTIFGEVSLTFDGTDGWHERLERVARENWQLYLRHPWLLQVATSRPPLGPHLIAKYDFELRAIDGIGLTDIEMDLVVQMVGDYVHGAARTAVSATLVAQRTGRTDEQWWAEVAPVLEKVLDPAATPTATRVGAAAGEEYNAPGDPARAFEFGLRCLLNGIDVLIAKKR